MSASKTNHMDMSDLMLLLRYDPETGNLFWRNRVDRFLPDNGRGGKAASRAAWEKRVKDCPGALTAVNSRGYLCGIILGKPFLAHRVAWALATGKWPDQQIDHINRDKTDNRFGNLREATPSQNRLNQKQRKSKSGTQGVYWSEGKGKWVAQAVFEGKSVLFKRFNDKEEAIMAYSRVVAELHRDFGGGKCR
jgi:hypothetical protein